MYSLSYKGIITYAIAFLFSQTGVPFVEGEVETVLTFLGKLAGALMIVFGQLRRKDLSILGFRK